MSEKFVKATPGPQNSVIYETEDGRKFIYSKGDPAWRTNNPGNLVPGNVSKRNGAIGKLGNFAIFPDYESGRRALIDSLKNSHGEKDLERMIKVYAPPHENRTKVYLRFLRKKTGVTGSKKIKDFTETEFEKLWKAIEQMEGSHKGTITEDSEKKKITSVRKNKKRTIIAYFIETFGWVSKPEGIRLTREGKVDAVIAHSRSGNLYLRARPDHTISNNLGAMG
jgi:hypothetical protein